MGRAVREARPARRESGTRRCMGTLVLDDLVDDPRVGGTRAEAPGDARPGGEDSRQPTPSATEPRDHPHGDREGGRRRAR